MNGPSDCDRREAVPSRTNRPIYYVHKCSSFVSICYLAFPRDISETKSGTVELKTSLFSEIHLITCCFRDFFL